MSFVGVCIIGAGIAGLGAAQHFIKSNFHDFLILEAQDRVGGRIYTVKHDDHNLELGAHWIHGEDGNIVTEWAYENNQTDTEPSLLQTGLGSTDFVRQNGEFIDQSIIDEFEAVMATVSENAEKDFKHATYSLGSYYKNSFQDANKWNEVGLELLGWHGHFLSVVEGSDDWMRISASGLNEYHECPGNPTINWKNGYSTLIEHFLEYIPKSKIKLNSPVKSIEWNKPSLYKCNIKLFDGMFIHAKYIIFTPSLAFLKVNTTMFEPMLPQPKLKAITGLSIDVVDKIFIEFDQRWWPENVDGFSILNNHDDDISPTVLSKDWELGILGFYETYKYPNMLCGWINGTAAQAMELTDFDEVKERCVAYLSKLLRKKYKLSNVTWFCRTQWGMNKWVLGSYSFRSMTTQALDVFAHDLAVPLTDSSGIPVVCFAGEATHECFYSTVHGALETGFREARRLLPLLTSHLNSRL